MLMSIKSKLITFVSENGYYDYSCKYEITNYQTVVNRLIKVINYKHFTWDNLNNDNTLN